MKRLGPVLRITIGLVGLTSSLLIAAQMLGLVPDDSAALLDKRRRVVEALAVQVAVEIDRLDVAGAQQILEAVVGLNPDMRSAALRIASGKIAAAAGDHARLWKGGVAGASTADYIRAPILDGERRWGEVEVAFAPVPLVSRFLPIRSRLLALVAFIGLTGSIGYFFVLRRSLKALDPQAVIPDRVRAAMDALAEGVIILDDQEQIVLANASFVERVGVPADGLIGRRASSMNWRWPEGAAEPGQLPWRTAMRTRIANRGTTLLLHSAAGEECRLVVNATPVLGAGGEVHGALASFADVTLLEQRNNELQHALGRLKESQEKIEQHNIELRLLATRDPLTGCLNRRALFASFEDEIAKARADRSTLSAVMVDIDHFKSINDRYGHATGDKVIALVAQTLRQRVGRQGVVARYGGEELCIVLPGSGAEHAHALTDEIRAALPAAVGAQFTSGMQVTFSAGVAMLGPDESDPADLLARADAALYVAKQGGRNRVVTWREGLQMDQHPATSSARRPSEPNAPASGTSGLHRVQEANQLEMRALVERVRELEERLRQQQLSQAQDATAHDLATGLPGEKALRDRMRQAVTRAQQDGAILAFLHLELEGLALIRETLGPLGGEQVMREIASRLMQLVRNCDAVAPVATGTLGPFVARLGAAEIGVLLDDLDRIESVPGIITRLLSGISQPLRIDGRDLATGCLIGASIHPIDGGDVDSLLRHASEARRLARRRTGVDRYALYPREGMEPADGRQSIAEDLRVAIERGELLIHYQPKMAVSNGRLLGFEALLRWQHPRRGLLRAADFIAAADDSGLILPIDEWVIRTAACAAKGWQRPGGVPLRVAVNVSTRQLQSERFAERLQGLLADAEAEPGMIEIEVGEGTVAADPDGAARVLRKLRNMGLHVSLDDFGTRYSPASYPRHLPIDSLKIDGTLISGIAVDQAAGALVSTIIGMAHELGIRVIAEGVETAEQLMMLRESQCDEAQGYAISKPLPVAEIPDFIRAFGEGHEASATAIAPQAASPGDPRFATEENFIAAEKCSLETRAALR